MPEHGAHGHQTAGDGQPAAASKIESWTDPDFPPDASSLCGGDFRKHPAMKGLVWKRAADVFGGAPFSVFDGLNPDDIHQGLLGNCYFLGACACLAEIPERAKLLFLTKQVNPAGR